MRRRLHIKVRRNFQDAVTFCQQNHRTHDARWMLHAFSLCRDGQLKLLLIDAPKPIVFEGQSFEMYEKTNLKYAIRKLIKRCR